MKPLAALAALTIVACFVSDAEANELIKGWFSYVSGDWTEERTVWEDGQSTESTHERSTRLVADGMGTITEQDQSVALSGWVEAKGIMISRTISTQGWTYSIKVDRHL